jgi:hypothetical protein
MLISGAVEGLIDEAVLRRLIEEAGATTGSIHGKQGKGHLKARINGYNNAARFSPWVVLVDLDAEAECAPPLIASWLPNAADHMYLRVAVRKIEAWLIADRERLAGFMGVSISSVPRAPESLPDPKVSMVALAKRSRRLEIRRDMVPRPGSGRSVGPAYTSRMIEFTFNVWRPSVAASVAESLDRCRRKLRELVTVGC